MGMCPVSQISGSVRTRRNFEAESEGSLLSSSHHCGVRYEMEGAEEVGDDIVVLIVLVEL